MVFNWFRRQFGTSEESSEETRSENPQVEQEQKANEQQSVESASGESNQEQSSEVAEDYLIWAKAAYKNIQKQQQVAVESPESVEVDRSTAQAITTASPSSTEATPVPETAEIAQSSSVAEEPEETVAPKDTEQLAATTATTTVELEEPATPETPEITETPLPATDISEAHGEASITETAEATSEEESAPVEAAVTESEVETTTEDEVATAQLADQTVETSTPEPENPTEVASAGTASPAEAPSSKEEETVEPILAESTAVESDSVAAIANLQSSEPSSTELAVPPTTEEAPAAPVPIWARQSDRQERLERLKATAIEIPEPEPVRAPVQPVEPTATTVEAEEIPGLAFDEGFLWSAEVLAAQGRRPEDVSIEEISWLKRLRQGLSKTRRSLINQLKAIVGQGPLNQDAVMEIEALLLQADVGVEATDYIINTLQQRLREEVLPPEEAIAYLKTILRDLLDRPCQESYSPTFAPEKDTLNIWLLTGVNGAGKTTTIGKLAHLAKKSDYRCLIGAADTFRAAAVEQVKAWGERSGIEVIANPGKNTDPAAVVFDAIAAAQARNTELLLVDTAGRLQNKKNLMEELAKIRQIVDKKAPNAKVESLLVLDATLGQNGLRQAEVFSEAAKLSGVVLTKLDGTAKGGVALAVVQQLGLPIRFIGAGEGIEDLRPFSSYEFVEALLSG